MLEALSMVGTPGTVTSDTSDAAFAADLIAAIGLHRHWDRVPV